MSFFLGGPVDSEGDRIPDAETQYDPSDLTTHGVIVGMTGSGKTGLGVIFLEEALRNNIPTLVIDPKGDMTNLLLTFPGLTPDEFEPWIDKSAAARDDKTAAESATDEAAKWKKGLGWWGLGGDDIQQLRDSTDFAIYTPGSTAGIPINIVGNLDVPALSWDTDAETIRDEIQGFVSGLLGLVNINADPISSREHILLSNLVEHSWRAGNAVRIADLIAQVATPPMRKLGVFEVDTFFPKKERMAFAMKLNGLLASPSFSSWMLGEPLDIEKLLWKDGKAQCSIIYIAHLSQTERQFIVTMVLTKFITWMRTQPGSGELRALIYMDEVFGFVPPTAQPPSKKPILTILKQARAFGVGMLLSTQNPVDLDYKAMSNAGTWCIGRLQTERDKARILEALSTAGGKVDKRALDESISGLKKRVFLLHNTREDAPEMFTTRWAMSYLRGPMTREEVTRISPPKEPLTSPTETAAESVALPTTEAATTGDSAEPEVADGISSSALHSSATWLDAVGYDATGDHYEAAVALTVKLRFDESRIGLDHEETWEAVLYPLSEKFDSGSLVEVDHDDRDFAPPEPGLAFTSPTAPISQSSYFRSLKSDLKKYLDRYETITVFRNKALKAISRPGESEEDFATRLDELALDRADVEVAKLTRKYAKRFRTAERAYENAAAAADTAKQRLDAERGNALLGFGMDLLSGRTPKVTSASRRSAKTRLRKAGDKIEAKRNAIEDLNDSLEDDVLDIRDTWSDKAAEIDPIEVGLESDDIEVSNVQLVWVRKG